MNGLSGARNSIEHLNSNGLSVVTTFVEPSLTTTKADDKFQLELHGYFVADWVDHALGKPVFNWRWG